MVKEESYRRNNYDAHWNFNGKSSICTRTNTYYIWNYMWL